MSTIVMPISVSRLKDADMRAVPAAMLRAAQRAREVAARTGTALIVTRNGELIEKTITMDMVAPSVQAE